MRRERLGNRGIEGEGRRGGNSFESILISESKGREERREKGRREKGTTNRRLREL